MEERKIKLLRESTGMNRKEFCERMRIPYRTVTDWELGNREPPDYLLDLIEYYISGEGLQSDSKMDDSQHKKGEQDCEETD